MKRLAILGMLCVSMGAAAEAINHYQAVSGKAYGSYFDQIAASAELGSRATQQAGWLYGFVGRSDLIPTLGESYIAPSLQQCEAPQDAMEVADPLGAVLDASTNHRVLLLNESHTHKQARLFLYNNLERLWAAGYRHIGFEALGKAPVSSIADLDAGDVSQGYYLNDPLFRGAVRKALALGFKVFPYEFRGPYPESDEPGAHVKVREHGQAQNIAAYLQEHAGDDKILIWAGYRHIAKSWNEEAPNWNWMAARLEHEFGIKGYSVDLTACQYEGPSHGSARLYRKDGQFLALGAPGTQWGVDGQFHLPSQKEIKPGYYRAALGQPVMVPSSLRESSAFMYVEAFREGQPQTGFSYDSIMLRDGEDLPLYLPAGDYVLVAYDKNGQRLGDQAVSVAAQ
ncbi:hypothetical protein ACFO5Q_08320 [Kordiimonas lipolytica]|uniref:Uncharacterized protein n=1 Tax=Kordiimonas lipolytica TaxID=1662421 RepID=A0ABV8UAY9_9PROT|nr:hypothetical protein [Kordiimonas lipolytica]